MHLKREDVERNLADIRSDRAPLSWAAAGGHGGAVKLFLEREDVNPDRADTIYGRAPLS